MYEQLYAVQRITVVVVLGKLSIIRDFQIRIFNRRFFGIYYYGERTSYDVAIGLHTKLTFRKDIYKVYNIFLRPYPSNTMICLRHGFPQISIILFRKQSNMNIHKLNNIFGITIRTLKLFVIKQ